MKRQIPLWLVGALAVVIVAVVGYWAAIRPKRAEVAKLDDEIAALKIQVDAAQQLAEQSGESQEPAIRVADVVKLAKAMPDRADTAGIIFELNAAAEGAGVAFTAIQPGTAVPASGYTVIPVSLTFEGSYFDLTELLYRLRNLVTVRDGVLDADGRLFTVDAVSFQEGTDGFPQVKATLTVSAYQYGVDPSALLASAGATAPPAPAGTATTTETTPTTVPAIPAEPSGGVQQAGEETP